VLFYPYFLPRSLAAPGRWSEFYLTGLADELKKAGLPATTAVGPAVGFARELAEIPDAWPLARLIGLRRLWRAARAGAPRFPARAVLDGHPVDFLLDREAAVDASRSARCDFALSFEAFSAALAAAPWKAVVYPWENQPQERLLALACRRAGVKAVAYQHTSVPGLQLEFFPSPGEFDWAPWPDEILCYGPRWLEILAASGVPRARLKLGGSRRFAHLHEKDFPAPGSDALVALPIDRWQGLQLLDALRRAFPNGGEGFDFVLKPHPAADWNPRDGGFSAEIFDGPLIDALRRAGRVIGTGSASILEGLAAGRPALRVLCETALNVDPGEAAAEAIPACFPRELRPSVQALLKAPAPSAAQARAAASLFSPVAPETWLAAVR
jgi:surface carbohydrate biosynthesis protein (TIGR04326 family)